MMMMMIHDDNDGEDDADGVVDGDDGSDKRDGGAHYHISIYVAPNKENLH